MARHVLLLCEYATLNGGERSMLATLEGVRRSGFVLTAAVPPAGPLADALRDADVEVLPLTMHDAHGHRRAQTCLRHDLAVLIRGRRYGLIHANSLAMGRLAGPVAAAAGVPSLSHVRDIVKLSRQAIADLNCQSRLLAVSQATRAFHVAAGLDAAKTHVLYNGVDLQRFCPRPGTGFLHRELDLTPGTPLVGTIGQIGLRKGHDVLIAAAARLASHLPEVHYVVVGQRCSGKDESRAFEAALHAAAAGPLAGRLHLLGVRDDVDRLLAELTLLVHPARQEPLGRVLLEAAGAGLPVVATDVGGTREIFPLQTESARLIPPGDPDRLAAAIRELIEDATWRGRLGQAARRRALEAFSADRATAGLVEHYAAASE